MPRDEDGRTLPAKYGKANPNPSESIVPNQVHTQDIIPWTTRDLVNQAHFTTVNFQLRSRRHQTDDLWWTSSGGSVFLPTHISSSSSSTCTTGRHTGGRSTAKSSVTSSFGAKSGSQTSMSSLSASGLTTSTSPSSGQIITATYTTALLTTITQPSTTFTSTSQTVITTTTSATALLSSSSPFVQGNAQVQPVCIGQGVDAFTDGVLATVILPSAIGLFLWVLFAVLRPRYRQLYALREWFIQPDLRPKPLGNSLWAFLFPHVPFVPSIPKDISNAGRSPAVDAHLFPSDEQLSQRTLWICFLIVLGWTLLGLGGALPLYLVSTPCLAQSAPPGNSSGVYSTMQDLSLMRLLQLLDSGNITTTNFSGLHTREIVDNNDLYHNTYARLIVLTALVVVFAILPALWKILHEFNKMVAYRRRWITVRCEGKEMAWLSARDAPGFIGWGEQKLKSFILRSGLSNTFEMGRGRNGRRGQDRRGDDGERPLTREEEANLEVDVQSLFSVGETHQLALLIEDRDEILENLEIAETRYITSFRLSTPEPSIADFEPPMILENKDRPQISRPRALAGATARRRRRRHNPAYAASSLAPTSFVAPSQYYKLRGVQGVSGGRFADIDSQQNFSDSIHQRVVGTRFQEVNRNSQAYGRLPIGSHVKLEKSGELGPSLPETPSSPPFSSRHGPNYDQESWIQGGESRFLSPHSRYVETPDVEPTENGDLDDEWVDLVREAPIDFSEDHYQMQPSTSTHGPGGYDEIGVARRRLPKIFQVRQTTEDSARRETFPLRNRDHDPAGITSPVPPHLRLQQQQPFVRPVSGVNHSDLGSVYSDISQWRSRLKAINAEIEEAQRRGYNDIADGTGVKGWLMVGRGLRFIPGAQLIEGRAKEDIRWDVLQNERSTLDSAVLWTVIAIVIVLLAAGLTAVSGLSLANAPDVAHALPFLQPLADNGGVASGLATALAPAVVVALFTAVAILVVNWATNLRGAVSISSGQLLVFKTTFFILAAVAAIWLIAVGALLFAIQAFNAGGPTSKTIANGSIYMSALAMVIVINVAIIFPALLLLQPFHLWHVRRAEKEAVTPRQTFRAVYPRTYDPTFATGACVLALIFACTFSLIFPLIGPAVVVLLFLTLVAHRYLVGYVYARTHSQTGGLLQIWLLQRFATLLAFQPLLLGLIFLSRRLWILSGVLLGAAVCVIILVEVYCNWKTRFPGSRSLSAITQDSLRTFTSTAHLSAGHDTDEENASFGASRGTRARGSMASVLDMMSLTLAVEPPSSRQRGPVPLQTDTLDDLTATERAARTHPDAPPHLPPLAFADHAEDMAGILYAPELIAPPPIIWLPNDSAGVARSEAYDLEKYHGLRATLDVRAKGDVIHRTPSH